MDKFEYIVEVISARDEDSVVSLLNARGSEGWEALHFYTIPALNLAPATNKIIFKRKCGSKK